MVKQTIFFDQKQLSQTIITEFLKQNNNFFEKLSDRVDIDVYSQKLHNFATHFTLYDGNILIYEKSELI